MAAFNPSAPDTGKKGGQYDPVPAGATMARVARVIEIGVQTPLNPEYKSKDKVVIAFSLPLHTMTIEGEEKQRFISNPFGISISNNEKSDMAAYTRAINPQAQTLGDFLNQPCQLSIINTPRKNGEGMSDRIDAVSPLMPGIEVPELDTEPFWFEWDNPAQDAWLQIPEFTKNLIRQAENYRGSKVEELDKAVEEEF